MLNVFQNGLKNVKHSLPLCEMRIAFEKYHGTGNDFIMINDADKLLDTQNVDWVKKLACRRFGIGSDGVILIRPHLQYDFEMIFFNPDGSQSFCGNGSRCAVAFARKSGYVKQSSTRFLSTDGEHIATIDKSNIVSLQMNPVTHWDFLQNDYFIHTGSPHYIKYVSNINEINVFEQGRNIRYSEPYRAEGTNVNFVETKDDCHIFVRTYERGVENETLSCGTGVTAAALSYAVKHNIQSGEVAVSTKGGELSVSFERNSKGFENIWLTGKATYVFKGEIEI